jgi:hypothetical protein
VNEMERKHPRKQTRMGRPPLAKEMARSNRVVTFVTDGELEELVHGAEREGRSLSGHVREILLRGMGLAAGDGEPEPASSSGKK